MEGLGTADVSCELFDVGTGASKATAAAVTFISPEDAKVVVMRIAEGAVTVNAAASDASNVAGSAVDPGTSARLTDTDTA